MVLRTTYHKLIGFWNLKLSYGGPLTLEVFLASSDTVGKCPMAVSEACIPDKERFGHLVVSLNKGIPI